MIFDVVVMIIALLGHRKPLMKKNNNMCNYNVCIV